jgi:hypothetical protein
MTDNVQNCDSYNNELSAQTYRYYSTERYISLNFTLYREYLCLVSLGTAVLHTLTMTKFDDGISGTANSISLRSTLCRCFPLSLF